MKFPAGEDVNTSAILRRLNQSFPCSYTVWKDTSTTPATYRAESNVAALSDIPPGTDAAAVINTVIDTLADGGRIHCRQAEYEINSTYVWVKNASDNGIILTGDISRNFDLSSVGGTVFKATAGLDQVIRVGDSTTPKYTCFAGVRDISVDCNAKATYGVWVDHATNTHVKRMFIHNAVYDGLYIYSPLANSDMLFEDVKGFNNGRHGIYMNKGEYATFNHCMTGGNQECGFCIQPLGGAGVTLFKPVSMNDGLNQSNNEAGIWFSPKKSGSIITPIVVGYESSVRNPYYGIRAYAQEDASTLTETIYIGGGGYVKHTVNALTLGIGAEGRHTIIVDGVSMNYATKGVWVAATNEQTIILNNIDYNDVTTPFQIGTPMLVRFQNWHGGWTSNTHGIEHHTTSDTLTFPESRSVHTNLGAGGTITLTLPQNANTGDWFEFVVMAAQELRIDPGAAGAIYIKGAKQTDDKYIMANDEGESIKLVADGNGDWVALYTTDDADWSVEV